MSLCLHNSLLTPWSTCGPHAQWKKHDAAVTHIAWSINDRVLITGDATGCVHLTLLPPSPNPLVGDTEQRDSKLLAAVEPHALTTLAAANVDAAAAHLGSAITSLEVRGRDVVPGRAVYPAPCAHTVAHVCALRSVFDLSCLHLREWLQCSPLDTSMWVLATANGKVTVWRTHVITDPSDSSLDQVRLQLLQTLDLSPPTRSGSAPLAVDTSPLVGVGVGGGGGDDGDTEWVRLASPECLRHAPTTDVRIPAPAGVEDSQDAHVADVANPVVRFAPNSTVLVCAVPAVPSAMDAAAAVVQRVRNRDVGDNDGAERDGATGGGGGGVGGVALPVMSRLLFYCVRARSVLRVVQLHEGVHSMAVTHVIRASQVSAAAAADGVVSSDGEEGAVSTGGETGASAASAVTPSEGEGAGEEDGGVASSRGLVMAPVDTGDALVPHLVVAVGTTNNRVVVTDEAGNIVMFTCSQSNPLTSLVFFDQPTSPNTAFGRSARQGVGAGVAPNAPTAVLGLAGASGAAVHVWDDIMALGY